MKTLPKESGVFVNVMDATYLEIQSVHRRVWPVE